ncbi:MAG: hypothetical protein K2J10_05370 [Muribaculaceae bacterium]|nr:hypothetical protein [Muribaculaceae bacterium]
MTASLSENCPKVKIANPDRQIIVSKADLTVTVADITIMQGQPLPDFTYIVEGLVYGETIEDIEDMPKPICDVTEQSPVGVYSVEFTEGYDPNYEITTKPAEVTVIATSGIDELSSESDNEIEVFDMAGVCVYKGLRSEARLERGFYIVRQGLTTQKIAIQ